MKKRLLFGLVLIALAIVGLGSRFNATAHAENANVVIVHVDGEVRQIATEAKTVKEALAKLGTTLQKHDKTEPQLSESIQGNDFTINVYRARPITVVDGVNTYTVMTAERSPRQIAEEAGFATKQEDEFGFERSDDPFEGAPGTQMVIKRAKTITFDLYGASSQLSTNETTVRELLEERNVKLEAGDEVNLPLAARISDGMTVSIASVTRALETVEEVAPFPEEQIRDAQQPTSYRKLQTPGVNGKKLVTYEIVSRNGAAPVRTPVKEVITEKPVKQVVIIGAKGNQFSGDFIAALGRLRSCEGGYTSVNPIGYYGAYQFNIGTWQASAPPAYANTRPDQAPPAVQDEAAGNLYKRRGWQPWPACSRKLGLQDIYR